MTDSDSSVDSSLCINLRNRKVLKHETDPAKRCKIVSSWPRTKTTGMAEGGTLPSMYDDKGNAIKGQDEDEPFDASTPSTESQKLKDELDGHPGQYDSYLSEELMKTMDQLDAVAKARERLNKEKAELLPNAPTLAVHGLTYGAQTTTDSKQKQISFEVDD